MPFALVTGCGRATLVPRTEVVVITADEQLTAPVAKPQVEVVVNEDLDRKALRMERALEECNARLDDIRAVEAKAAQDARQKDNTATPWWRRLFGGS